MSKFYKTKVVVEVLSEGPYSLSDLDCVLYDITEGPCVGKVYTEATSEVSAEDMPKLLTQFGSDPDFFSFGESD